MNDLLEVHARPKFIDYTAPDGSEIRLLKDGTRGGLTARSVVLLR